jgi:hypothetical protein
MESFSAKSKRNGSEVSLSELMGDGTSTRIGARQKAFMQIDEELVKALTEENEVPVDVADGEAYLMGYHNAIEEMRPRLAALEHGLPKVGRKSKDGVVKVVHLVCISKSGNRIYVKDLGEGMMEALKESFVSCYGFKTKAFALAYVDNAAMLDNSIKMF